MKREILIVEDHLYVRQTLTDWLVKAYPEFEILATDNGEDAIDTAQVRPPSLILMDLHLPHIDGFETTRRIKAFRPDIPILIMTEDDSDLHKDLAFSAGADAYLSKNRLPLELLPIINKLLSSAERWTMENTN
jgi:two-component system OmpR family response regulator